jgi:hypothetical protein
MIYNNAQFMNAPLEVLIRRFREKLTSGQFAKLEQTWPAFETFLLEFQHSEDDEREHFRGMVVVEVGRLQTNLMNHMILRIGRRARKGEETPEAFTLRQVRARQTEAEAIPLEGDFLADITLANFSDAYGELIDGIATPSLRPVDMNEELQQALHAMMLAVIKSKTRSSASTGFVFAGFGTEDLFPTLYAVEVDGVYFGRFRILDTKFVDIDRAGETAAVVPFAQTDMPERFILGIDGEFETAVERLAVSLVGHVVDQKRRAFAGGLGDDVKAAAAKQFRDGLERLKKRNAQNLNAVVNHLSKKELGEVAYSLVELTSRKRRYSSDLETVGGPIDVAILTRNEGFIWVRRKHYFDAELNPRYFNRQ